MVAKRFSKNHLNVVFEGVKVKDVFWKCFICMLV